MKKNLIAIVGCILSIVGAEASEHKNDLSNVLLNSAMATSGIDSPVINDV